jgi:hypothetical protein
MSPTGDNLFGRDMPAQSFPAILRPNLSMISSSHAADPPIPSDISSGTVKNPSVRAEISPPLSTVDEISDEKSAAFPLPARAGMKCHR